jgi:hypothetical protein
MRSLPLAVLLASLSSTAFAADAPKVIGTWVPVAFSSAHAGTGGAFPDSAKPTFVKDPAAGWTLTIDSQDGAAFSGMDKGPDGKSGVIAGVFRMDGQRFILSTVTGAAAGEVIGDQLEICWTDNIPNFIGAGCTVYKRQ